MVPEQACAGRGRALAVQALAVAAPSVYDSATRGPPSSIEHGRKLPMADDTVTLALDGEVALAQFASAVTKLDALVNSLTEAVADGSEFRWIVERLDSSSAVVTVRPEGPDAALATSVAKAYLEVGQSLEAGQDPPFPPQVRARATDLASLISDRITAIRFETSEAEAIVRRVREAEGTELNVVDLDQRTAFGAIEGVVQTLSNRRGLRFTLYDTVFDKAVSCYLDAGRESIMRDAWGRRAIVEGSVTRDPESARPLSVRRISHVELVTEYPPGSYRLARGVLPRRSGDPKPEEAIRRVRDAE